MCRTHELYHYPVELRDLAYRIVDIETVDGDLRERRKAVALLLLKQATASGLLDYLDSSVCAVRGHTREQSRAKVLSLMAAYSAEAYQMLMNMPTDDVPF